jgi:co-chaperonin GroES (HSP10)
MTYPQPILNHVLVTVESEKVDMIHYGSLELKVAGTEGLEDVSKYAQTMGHVVNVPRGMSNGIPYKYIVPEVQVDDDVVLHYSAIDDTMAIEHNGERLYLVPYEYIFAAIRNGEIVMIGGRVLCEAIQAEGVVNDDGINVIKSPSGIITAINVPHDAKFATLSHIGTPLKGSPTLSVKIGDVIAYPRDADWENEIMGKKYFCMTQEDILMHEPKQS